MQITISYPSGFDVEGVTLTLGDTTLRVAMRGWDDAAVFECRDGQWFAENGDPVVIDWPESLARMTPDRSIDRASLWSPAPVAMN